MFFKTNKNKFFIFLFSTLILFNSNKMILPTSCNAAEIPNTTETYSDVYVYKYRINSNTGRTQKRLWNKSKGIWAEPYWHDV